MQQKNMETTSAARRSLTLSTAHKSHPHLHAP
jgi:hypothetical protein